MKLWLAGSLMLTVLALPLAVRAGNISVTGGTNGPLCNSGGYFTPSQVTVTSGDTITFNVPSTDPYSGGLQVHGFPEGDFTIPRGGSHTTAPLTANVSYNGTWPSSGCLKGSGSVTVNAPATPPPGTPAPTHATTSTSTKTITPTPTPSPSKSASPSPSSTPAPSPGTSSSPSPAQAPVTASGHTSGPSLFLAASTGALALGVIAVLVALGLWWKRRLMKPAVAPAAPAPPTSSSDDTNRPLI